MIIIMIVLNSFRYDTVILLEKGYDKINIHPMKKRIRGEGNENQEEHNP